MIVGSVDLETMKLPDLRKLEAAVAAELLLRSSEQPTVNRYSLFQHWHQAFADIMQTVQAIRVPPPAVFSRQLCAKGFTNSLPLCEELIGKFRLVKGPVLRQHQELKARRTVIGTLIIWMKNHAVSISVSSVCRNMQNAQAAVASEFPGYIQNGLLYMLIK